MAITKRVILTAQYSLRFHLAGRHDESQEQWKPSHFVNSDLFKGFIFLQLPSSLLRSLFLVLARAHFLRFLRIPRRFTEAYRHGLTGKEAHKRLCENLRVTLALSHMHVIAGYSLAKAETLLSRTAQLSELYSPTNNDNLTTNNMGKGFLTILWVLCFISDVFII